MRWVSKVSTRIGGKKTRPKARVGQGQGQGRGWGVENPLYTDSIANPIFVSCKLKVCSLICMVTPKIWFTLFFDNFFFLLFCNINKIMPFLYFLITKISTKLKFILSF